MAATGPGLSGPSKDGRVFPEPPKYAPRTSAAYRLANRTWISRFFPQLRVLFFKNVLVSIRNLRASVLRLLAPLFFMFLLWLINLAVRQDIPYIDYATDNPSPVATVIGSIPACSSNPFALESCLDFIYTPVGDPLVEALVAEMRANNPGRPIPESAVLGLEDVNATNVWLLEHPGATLTAVHFLPPAGGGPPDYLLQANTSYLSWRNVQLDPSMFALLPLQVSVERELARASLEASGLDMGAAGLGWSQAVNQMAHPQTNSLNIVGQGIGPFVFAANMFNFVLLLASLVTEKELGLRQALSTAGMLDAAFWTSWVAMEAVSAVLFSLLIIAFGAAFQFAFFLENGFAVLFLLFFLFQLAMMGVAMTLSALLRRASSAVLLGFVVFIVGWVCQAVVAFGFPYEPEYVSKVPALNVIFALLPWCMLAKGSVDLGLASTSSGLQGIQWSSRNAYCLDATAGDYVPPPQDRDYYVNGDCVWPLGQILWILALQFAGYTILAVYLDNVLPDRHGVRRSPFYFFAPGYWWAPKHPVSKALDQLARDRGARAPPLAGQDADVAAEEASMRRLLLARAGRPREDAESAGSSGTATSSGEPGDHLRAIEVYGLGRVFDGRSLLRRIFSRPREVAECPSAAAAEESGVPPPLGSPSPSADASRLSSLAAPPAPPPAPRPSQRGVFWAVHDSWFSIERGTCMCLLGANGAGKTTTINCLTGVLPLSAGDALVEGQSIASGGGMDRARAVMGVCPQFDVLWSELTGREHLLIYGVVKGLGRAEARRQAQDLLDRVRLTGAARVQTRAYSGGMRRRLSVACALLGDPLVVFLDEPTTGMDPISRRQVWDVVEAAKRDRAIVLTTHSMEEADILGDKIAIMARGRLKALGTPLRLKQRFGTGYQLSISVTGGPTAAAERGGAAAGPPSEEHKALVAARERRIRDLFEKRLGLSAARDPGAYVSVLVPKAAQERLPNFLALLEHNKAVLGVADIHVAQTSLEEVFLTIARAAELEAARAEGRCIVQHPLSDGAVLDVGLGEDVAALPDGRRFAITWAQDEAGALQILRAQEIPEAR